MLSDTQPFVLVPLAFKEILMLHAQRLDVDLTVTVLKMKNVTFLWEPTLRRNVSFYVSLDPVLWEPDVMPEITGRTVHAFHL